DLPCLFGTVLCRSQYSRPSCRCPVTRAAALASGEYFAGQSLATRPTEPRSKDSRRRFALSSSPVPQELLLAYHERRQATSTPKTPLIFPCLQPSCPSRCRNNPHPMD